MSTIHGSTIHRQHHYRASLKKKLKQISHKLHDTPSYSHIGNGFQRLPNLPKEIVNIMDYNDQKHISRFSQSEDGANVNVDAEATDFIQSMHKKFEVNHTISMI
ncbi:hypothetical protein Hanom_Chr08g00683881 [Helianthus anomalus]